MKNYFKTTLVFGLMILGALVFVAVPAFAASTPSHAPRHPMTTSLPNFKKSRSLASVSPAGKHIFGVVSSVGTDSITVAVNTGHGTTSSTSDVVMVDAKTVYGGSIVQTGFSGIKTGDHVVVMTTSTSSTTAREVSVIDSSAFANQARNALSKSKLKVK